MQINKMNLSERDRIQVKKIVSIIEYELDSKLVSLYLFGSAVDEGLKVNSDLDFLAITKSTIPDRKRVFITKQLMNNSREIGTTDKIRYVELTSVVLEDLHPWKHPITQDFIYGEWLREEYQLGEYSQRLINPDLTILLYQIQKQGILLIGKDKQLSNVPFSDVKLAIRDQLDILVTELDGDESNVILTLCRMLYTLKTQEFISKNKAANYVVENFSTIETKVILAALDEYLTGKLMNEMSTRVKSTVHQLIQQIKNEIGV